MYLTMYEILADVRNNMYKNIIFRFAKFLHTKIKKNMKIIEKIFTKIIYKTLTNLLMLIIIFNYNFI